MESSTSLDDIKELALDGANFPETLTHEQIRELAMTLASLILTPDELKIGLINALA